MKVRFDYSKAKEFIDEELLNDPAVFPGDEEIAKYEMYKYLLICINSIS